jgi:DNA-binding winged helix-turn-helix (wHTH) protein
MLKLVDLANRADFDVGPIHVSPARRLIRGPAGSVNVEPIVMKVFLLLLEARGKVVTRDELFANAWGGVYVGDDSLNRAIARVRKIATEVAPGLFELETVPRTGYRMSGEIVAAFDAAPPEEAQPRVSRRSVIVGGTAAAAIVAGGGLLLARRAASTRRFDALMARGDEAFRNGSAFEDASIGANNSPHMIRLYHEATGENPKSARAWGLLAYFITSAANDGDIGKLPGKVAQAQTATRRALDLDPTEPNARVAMYLLQGTMFDWATRDRQLRDILATDPANLPAMMELMPLLQSAGLTRESWLWNERMLKASPFLRPALVVRGLKLWIMGRLGEADSVIDRVLDLWPGYRFGIYARFTIFALTGRPLAARAILDGTPMLAAPEMRRAVLDAMESRVARDIEKARAICLKVAAKAPPLSNDVVMYLCALGLTETAFEVTEGFLLWRGKFISLNPANRREADTYNRRMTQWLFTPPVAEMRTDPRFAKLCEEFGLTAYWQARHVRADYLVYG